jgi:Lrp/AsnC family leucine-responsive transcriptional regulator
MIIDLKDKKILRELEIDSRRSNSQIARKVGISKDAVSYRINNLEKKRVIKGYYSVLNMPKLGLIAHKFMITFQNTNEQIENEIIDYLKGSKNVGWLVSCDGPYNLMVISWVKNAIVFDNFLSKFLKKYSKYIRERDIIIITENHSCRKAYLFNEKKDDFEDISYSGEPFSEVNEKDLRITQLLADNARSHLYLLSEKVGLTPEAIASRLKQLRKNEIIQSFRPSINTSLLGYQYYNVLFRLRKFDNINEIFNFFKSQPNIIYFVRYIGSYDLGIDLEVSNVEELRNILLRIKNRFSGDIESYTPILVYAEHKLSFFPH